MTPQSPSGEPRPTGVIHDLGYRPYQGARLGEATVARSLLVTGFLNAFGLRRSGRAKVLPFLLLTITTIPAVVIVAVMITIGVTDPPIGYSQYPIVMSLLITVFVAAQAPTLFSQDLRYGTIVLYLARPMRAATYAVMRWLSLLTAVLVVMALPMVVLYVGALLAGARVGEETSGVLAGLAGAVLLAALLATFAGVVSAWTMRRGLAVAGVIIVLLVGFGVVSAVQGIAVTSDRRGVAEIAGLFSPFTLFEGAQHALLGGSSDGIAVPSEIGTGVLYLGVSVLICVAGVLLLVRRYQGQVLR